MKVGIMSMQRVKNYGSFLQAYGLKKNIESLGHEVVFVDYKVEPALNKGDGSTAKKDTKLVELAKKCFYKAKSFTPEGKKVGNMYKKHREFIDKFEEWNFPVLGIDSTMHYRTPLDVLVIGSDEVFNCLQVNPNVGYSRELFGKDNNAKKLITYAASFGNTTTQRLKQYGIDKEVGALLKDFDAISVRDTNSGKVVKDLTGKEPIYNLDPVLISDYSDEMVKNVPIHDYIIIYGYPGRITEAESKIIRDFANKRNKKLICIQGIQEFCDEYVNGNPFEILAYFRNADCIITDTFHGSIFSIINHRPFVSRIRKTVGESYGNEEKMTDLLKRLGLEDRILTDISRLEALMNTPIDYERVDAVRKNEREKSLAYLEKMIGRDI